MRRLIAAHLILGILLSCCRLASAEETVRVISWPDIAEENGQTAGEILPDGYLSLENVENQPITIEVLKLKKPGIEKFRYALTGEVRYEGVSPGSYLEMWNHFVGGQFFSRTLATSGPMKSLDGSDTGRTFVLPFLGDETTGKPLRLVLNVVFTGSGRVELGPLQLIQYENDEDPMSAAGVWWNDRTGGLIGAVGGTILGILGCLIGVLGSLGKYGRLAFRLAFFGLLLGLVALVGGIVAFGLGQPYAVYYPLLLGGMIATPVFGGALLILRRRFLQAERRKIASMDVGIEKDG